jgi:hypothetical protein
MKRSAKNSTKLALRGETLRVLVSVKLVHVVGGTPLQGNDSAAGPGCVIALAVVTPKPG